MEGELIKCDCGTHAVQVEHWDHDYGLVSVYLWHMGRVGFHNRLKVAWAALLGRNVMSEDFVLTPENAQKLAEELTKVKSAG